jgi:hypothetical protein
MAAESATMMQPPYTRRQRQLLAVAILLGLLLALALALTDGPVGGTLEEQHGIPENRNALEPR